MTWSSMEIFLINFPIKRDARQNVKAYEERAQKSQEYKKVRQILLYIVICI